MPVHNAEIAAMFDQTADLLDIEGENPFRVRAYRNAARVIGALPQSVKSLLAAGHDLSELPGIGKDLAGKIGDIVNTGRFKLLETLKRKLPGELGEMAALPGLGPKRVKLLYDKLHVGTLADLKHAVETGRLRKVRGFGPTIEQKLVDALKQPRRERRFKLPAAEADAEALVERLRDGGQVVVAGSYRRRRETVGDLDILVTGKDGEAIGERLTSYENVAEVLARGPTRTTVVLRSGIQVDLRVVPEESYGAALLYFTGSRLTTSPCAALPMSEAGSSTNMACSRASGGSPAQPKRTSTRSWDYPSFRPSCARIAARSRRRSKHICRISLRSMTSKVTFTFIPTGPTELSRSPKWPQPRSGGATNTSP